MGNIISDFFKGKPKDKKGGPKVSVIEPVSGLSAGGDYLESPYLQGRREWNERYGSYIKRARTWQYVALASLGLSAVLGGGLVKVASQSKVQPFVVVVDKLGQAVAVRYAEAIQTPDDRVIQAQLANFIANSRNVTPDPVVQKRWLDAAYAIAGTAAVQYLNDHYRKNDPFAVARNYMVSADLQPPMRLSKDSWQVQWTETTRTLSGQVDGVPTRWQAVLNVTTASPTTPAEIIANPSGVVIDVMTWTQQL